MPNVVRLIEKSTERRLEGSDLLKLDEAICAHLNVPVDPVKWCEGWMDTIGFSLAIGKDWDEMREQWKEFPEELAIIEYLEPLYSNDSYYTVR